MKDLEAGACQSERVLWLGGSGVVSEMVWHRKCTPKSEHMRVDLMQCGRTCKISKVSASLAHVKFEI